MCSFWGKASRFWRKASGLPVYPLYLLGIWSDFGPKGENPSLFVRPCPGLASPESPMKRFPTEMSVQSRLPSFVYGIHPPSPTPPLDDFWRQTSKMMLPLVASWGSQTLQIEAGITPNACFQRSSFSFWNQFGLQNEVPKMVPELPFGHPGAVSGHLWHS